MWAESNSIVYPVFSKAFGIVSCNILLEKLSTYGLGEQGLSSQALSSSIQWQDKMQGAQTEIQEDLPEHKAKSFYHEHERAPAQLVQRGW